MKMHVASPGAGQLDVTADRSAISLLAGSQERVELTIKNNGGSPLPVEIGVEGPPSQWLALSQTLVSLAPAQTASVTLTLSAPQEAPTGSYPLAINIQARDDPATRVRLEFVFEIAEPGQVVLELTPPQVEAQGSAEFQVQVRHSGSVPLDVRLSASDDESACNYTFNPPTLHVAPYETATTRLTVSARHPLVNSDTRLLPFVVTATTAQGMTDKSEAHGRFVQMRVPALQIAVNPNRQTGPAAVTYSVTVTNPTQVQTIVRLTASDTQAGCRYQFNPASITLPASSSRQATLTVTPLQYRSEPGEILHTFTVRADPSDGMVSPVETSGTFLQTTLERPVASLTPSSQSSAGTATFTLQVSNLRTVPMQVEISPTGSDGMLEGTVSPNQLIVPANGRMTARVTVRPTSALLPGEQRRTCPFTVQVRTAELDEPVEVKGSLIQVPGAPVARWLGIAAAALLALLLCAGLLWFAPPMMNSLGGAFEKASAFSLPTPLPAVTPVPNPTITLTPTPPPTPDIVQTLAAQQAAADKAAQQAAQAAAQKTADAQKAAAQKTADAQKAAAQQTANAEKATNNANATATAAAQKTVQARYAQYNGNWANDDANTNGITRLQISNNNEMITVHGYGKCSPTDCDWKTRTQAFTTEPFTILFDFGGGLTHQLTLSKEGSKLKVVDVGSSSGTHTYTFHTVIGPLIPIDKIPQLPPVINK